MGSSDDHPQPVPSAASVAEATPSSLSPDFIPSASESASSAPQPSKNTSHQPLRVRKSHFDYVHTKTFTPREYQVELLDSARERNVISCLGTGSGKTFIAVMLIKELSHQLRGNFQETAKRAIFLCPTVSLAQQQKRVLEDHTDLTVKEYVGSQGLEFWLQEEWLEEFCKYQVLVMTPDVFKAVMFSGFMPLSKVNLLILDECHHAVKNHPYREIMRCFDTCPVDERPKILGLSSSLLNHNCKPEELEQKIRNLEQSLRCRVETGSDLSSLHLHVTKPRVDRCIFLPYFCDEEFLTCIKGHLECALDFLSDVVTDWVPEDNLPDPVVQPKRYLMEVSHVLLTLGPWCAQKAAKVFMKEISQLVAISYSTTHIQLIMVVRTVLEIVYLLCERCMEGYNNHFRLITFAPDKLKCLLKILKEFKPEEQQNSILPPEANDSKPVERQKLLTQLEESKTLCGIVFVKQRVTAFVLNAWLQEVAKVDPDFQFLSPSYVVGHNVTNRTRGTSMNSQHQEDTLRRFRMREHNLIVATSVVEEGIDVPRCNLVVRFDLPSDFRAYIQSKGRARAPGSVFVLMIPSDQQQKAIEQLVSFHTIEKILSRQCGPRNMPSEEEIDDQLADQLAEPYMPVKEDGAPRVTMSSAIALVNRYCGKLPSDTFTRLTPKWSILSIESTSNTLYQCLLSLPINSPLKEKIKGDQMPSKKLSQMSAALEACKKLHQIGELDNNLLPVGKESVRFEEDPSLNNEEVPPGAPRPGTTKRRQYYYKMVAEVLQGSGPKPEVVCFLYRFSMHLTCPIPQEQNTRGRRIHDPATTSRGFGILTTKSIPPVCHFPVFTRSGEVTISLECVSSELIYTQEQLKQLLNFHRYTYAEVLRLEKYPMLFEPEDADHAYYVVPINKESNAEVWDVDWKFVSEISKLSQNTKRKISEEEREKYVFRTEDYTDAVVMPWYRNLDKPQLFYVAEICSDLSPKSTFPDVGHKTFEGYYQEKYNIKIKNLDQPLLDVDHTSARLNLLTPRYVNRKGMTLPTSSEQTKKAKRENLQQKQILVPELCIVHPFPASLWRKAVCLPCILYRINSLLLAEQLRVTVAKEIGVGTTELPNSFTWPALDFGWTLAEVLEKAAQQALKEDQSKPSLTTSKPPKLDSIKPIPNTWNTDISNSSNSDFVIDTFDPSKVHIPDDDDFLLDQEVAHLNFGSGPIWSTPQLDNPDGTVTVRYGSPSRFEGTGWDSEWDTDLEENNMFQLNIPGLGYISAPSGFNIQGLSHDLASCRDDDIWDSDFDDDSICDELDDHAESPIPASGQDKSSLEDCSQLTITNKGLTVGSQESYVSEWLSQCSNCSENQKSASVENNTCSDANIDDKVHEDVSILIEKAKQSIVFKCDVNDCQNVENMFKNYPKLCEAVSLIEKHSQSEAPLETEKQVNGVADDDIILTEQDVSLSPITDFQSIPTFGELLPGRDHLPGDDSAIFRVHFDEQPNLPEHEGPSPSIILQALTMSNANDGINLERLETVGDSFLKYAITAYLYCSYPDIHEGKLSYLRSKQISNLHLYRLGKRCCLGNLMIASKFEPNDNWLPPCYTVPKGLEQAFIDSGMPAGHWNIGNMRDLRELDEDQIRMVILEEKKSMAVKKPFIDGPELLNTLPSLASDETPYIRYNLLTQQSIPDKSIADCVESLIGAYLICCGPRGALLFMSWLGLRVLPDLNPESNELKNRYGFVKPPKSPLLTHVSDPQKKLDILLTGYSEFENRIGYQFNDRSYLLQAFTHASYHYNRLTDCYQRLEFLGDAVLDYLITRHLYEDPQQHYPGVLTDLRSALVNNTFFASLAVKYEFHKYFKAVSPGLFGVIGKFVDIKKKNPNFIHFEEYYLEEDECEEAEEVEVPKALGDIFESVAGAIYLDSGMSLDTVWRVYFAMMKPEIEYFSTHVPKSPIRELLETYPQTARFDRAEMTLSGKVRVRVEVVGQGQFVGLGRNKRIAKCTAAKRALRALKRANRIH